MSPSRSNDADDGLVLSKIELARLLDVSLPTVEKWLHRGLHAIERGRQGRPWRIDCGQAVDWLLAEQERKVRDELAASGAALNLEHERAREAKARADKYEIENAALRQSLIPRSEVVNLWAQMQAGAAEMADELLPKIARELHLDERQVASFRALFEISLAELETDGIVGDPEE